MNELFKRFGAQAKGNVAMIFALALPLVVGGAGFGVETTYWYYRSVELQAAADAAAHAGAIERRAGSDAEEAGGRTAEPTQKDSRPREAGGCGRNDSSGSDQHSAPRTSRPSMPSVVRMWKLVSTRKSYDWPP